MTETNRGRSYGGGVSGAAADPEPKSMRRCDPARASRRSMRKNVHLCEARKVESHPIRQIGERGLRQSLPVFACEHRIEPRAQRMEMQDVGGGVSQLRLAQRGRAPVGRLLLF